MITINKFHVPVQIFFSIFYTVTAKWFDFWYLHSLFRKTEDSETQCLVNLHWNWDDFVKNVWKRSVTFRSSPVIIEQFIFYKLWQSLKESFYHTLRMQQSRMPIRSRTFWFGKKAWNRWVKTWTRNLNRVKRLRAKAAKLIQICWQTALAVTGLSCECRVRWMRMLLESRTAKTGALVHVSANFEDAEIQIVWIIQRPRAPFRVPVIAITRRLCRWINRQLLAHKSVAPLYYPSTAIHQIINLHVRFIFLRYIQATRQRLHLIL